MDNLGNPTLDREKRGSSSYVFFFLFWRKNIDCGYSFELPQRGDSDAHQHSMFGTEIRKLSSITIY